MGAQGWIVRARCQIWVPLQLGLEQVLLRAMQSIMLTIVAVASLACMSMALARHGHEVQQGMAMFHGIFSSQGAVKGATTHFHATQRSCRYSAGKADMRAVQKSAEQLVAEPVHPRAWTRQAGP